MGWSEIVSLALKAAIIPLIGQGILWLSRRIRGDEYQKVVAALKVGVENIGYESADQIRQDFADGVMTSDEWAGLKVAFRNAAVDQARQILDGPGRAALCRLSEDAIDNVIRYLVDQRQKEKALFEAQMKALESAEREKRKAEMEDTMEVEEEGEEDA